MKKCKKFVKNAFVPNNLKCEYSVPIEKAKLQYLNLYGIREALLNDGMREKNWNRMQNAAVLSSILSI